MRLQHQLVLPQARIQKVWIALGKEEHKVALEISTALTREVAESFGCADLVFAGNVPRSGVEKMILEGTELNCDIHLEHGAFSFATVADEVCHFVAHMEGEGARLVFRVKFTGYVITVADLIEHVKIDPLEVILKPSQLDLELKPEEAKEAPAEDGPCVDCNNQIPLAEGDPAHHVSGQPCEAVEPEGATIAPASVMGGTHQKRGRGRPRKVEPVAPPADFMADIEETIQ